jgi:preprotein translocase subunit YajC
MDLPPAIVRANRRFPNPKQYQGNFQAAMDANLLMQIVPFVAIFAIMYFLLIRPQQQRLKEHRAMVENVKRGDTVVTAGGIVGKVAKVREDGEIMVDIADNVQVRILKSTLSEVRAKGQPVESKE